MNDVMHRKRARRILGDLKMSVELRTRHRMRRVDFRGSLRPDEFVRHGCCTRWVGCRWKNQHRKIVYLPPYVEAFNSKVIKGFVPELRSRYVFFVFRDSYVLCIYVMNILCTFCVAISWLCNTINLLCDEFTTMNLPRIDTLSKFWF